LSAAVAAVAAAAVRVDTADCFRTAHPRMHPRACLQGL